MHVELCPGALCSTVPKGVPVAFYFKNDWLQAFLITGAPLSHWEILTMIVAMTSVISKIMGNVRNPIPNDKLWIVVIHRVMPVSLEVQVSAFQHLFHWFGSKFCNMFPLVFHWFSIGCSTSFP